MPDQKIAGVAGNRTPSGIDTGEYLRSLSGSAGRRIYDQMRRSDPQIAATLRAIELPIRQAKYSVESASDSSKDKEIAAIIEANILRGMSITWDDTLRHALLSLPFGFSILEKVWILQNGMAYLKKLDPRLPQSIADSSQWTWDQKTGELVSIKQRDAAGRDHDLPIEKLLVFSVGKEGDNWEGLPLLRSCYKPWKIKDDLEKINVINHDRNGVGIPIAKMPEGINKGSQEWTQTEQVLEALCANEQGYLIVPSGADVDILGGEGKATDTLTSIKFYDEAISRALLAQFINLGTTETGSRALGGSFIDFFMTSLQAYAGYICDVINRFLIREYVDYNWNVTEYPIFKVGPIKTLDPAVIAQLQQAGVIAHDLATENLVRQELHLPEVEEAPVTVQQPKRTEPIVDEQAQNEDGEQEQKVAASYRLSTTPDQFPGVDFQGMELRLNIAASDFTQRILQIREAQRASIVDQIVAGKSIQNIVVPRKKDMYDLLMEAYREQFKAGGSDVRKEIEAQGFKLADPVRKDNLSDEQKYSKYAKIQVEGAANKLKTTLAQEEANLTGQDLKPEGLKKALDIVPISNITWQKMVNGAVNCGWGDGRESEAQKHSDEIDRCYYSALLDRNTCGPCSMKDGIEHEIGDPEFETPNPNCEGGDFCRCMTVFVMKAESAKEGG